MQPPDDTQFTPSIPETVGVPPPGDPEELPLELVPPGDPEELPLELVPPGAPEELLPVVGPPELVPPPEVDPPPEVVPPPEVDPLEPVVVVPLELVAERVDAVSGWVTIWPCVQA